MNQITEEAGVEFLPLYLRPSGLHVAGSNSKAFKGIGELIAGRLTVARVRNEWSLPLQRRGAFAGCSGEFVEARGGTSDPD